MDFALRGSVSSVFIGQAVVSRTIPHQADAELGPPVVLEESGVRWAAEPKPHCPSSSLHAVSRVEWQSRSTAPSPLPSPPSFCVGTQVLLVEQGQQTQDGLPRGHVQHPLQPPGRADSVPALQPEEPGRADPLNEGQAQARR